MAMRGLGSACTVFTGLFCLDLESLAPGGFLACERQTFLIWPIFPQLWQRALIKGHWEETWFPFPQR